MNLQPSTPDSIRRRQIALEIEVRRRRKSQGQFNRLPLYPKQAAIIDDPARFTITEATTKAGKTMSHLEWLLSTGIAAGEGHWWWVAQVSDTSDIAFRRAQDRLKGYIDTGGELKKVDRAYAFVKNETRKVIKINGATFWFKSADEPDSLFGEDVRGAVGDEITRWKPRSYDALYTTLTATKGRAKFIGNVNGRHNFAYKLARKAQAGAENWGYHKLTALDAIAGGVIDAEIVKQAQADLKDSVYKELYLAEASEDGTNPFNLKAIAAGIAPISSAPVIAYGLDIARKKDWMVLIGLDINGHVARHERWRKFALWADKEKEIISIVGATPCLADSTGVGDRVVEALQVGCSQLDGYIFTETSRQQLLEGLEVGIQSGQIGYPDGIIRSQLESFEIVHTRRGVRYEAPEKMPDDDAIALALAREQYRRLIRGPIGNQPGNYAESDIDY